MSLSNCSELQSVAIEEVRRTMTIVSACVRWVSDLPSLHVNVRSLRSSCPCQFHHWIGQSAGQRQEGNYPRKCLCSKAQFTFDMAAASHINWTKWWPSPGGGGGVETCSISRFFSSKIPPNLNLQSTLAFFPTQEYPFCMPFKLECFLFSKPSYW